MSENKLGLARQKTKKILKDKRGRSKVVFKLDEVVVVLARSVKYLGIWIDNRRTHGEHIKKTVEKTWEVQDTGKRNYYIMRYSPSYCMGLRHGTRLSICKIIH